MDEVIHAKLKVVWVTMSVCSHTFRETSIQDDVGALLFRNTRQPSDHADRNLCNTSPEAIFSAARMACVNPLSRRSPAADPKPAQTEQWQALPSQQCPMDPAQNRRPGRKRPACKRSYHCCTQGAGEPVSAKLPAAVTKTTKRKHRQASGRRHAQVHPILQLHTHTGRRQLVVHVFESVAQSVPTLELVVHEVHSLQKCDQVRHH